MNLKQKKFVYLLKQFIQIWKESKGENSEEISRNFSNVKIMKLQYFFCLLGGKIFFGENWFGEFVAYPKGPVNEDSYFFQKSDEGQEIFNELCKGGLIKEEMLPDEKDRKVIDEVVKDQWDKLYKLVMMPVDELVEESHTQDGWTNAYFYSQNPNRRVMDINYVEVDKENLIKFLNILAAA